MQTPTPHIYIIAVIIPQFIVKHALNDKPKSRSNKSSCVLAMTFSPVRKSVMAVR